MDNSNSPETWARQRNFSNNGGHVEQDKRGPPGSYGDYPGGRDDAPPLDALDKSGNVAASDN